jgi:putative ABC transport system permease protein
VNAQSRQRELAVRAALGARPSRLARLLIVETLWLSVAGGAAGLLLAPWCLRGFLALYPETLPAVGDVELRLTAVLVAAGATILTAVLTVIPPLMMIRTPQLQATIRAGERGAEQRYTRASLVVTQVALSTALLVGGGLLLRTFLTMKGTAVGFEASNVLTFNLALGEARYPDLPAEVRFYDDLLARVRALPGVTAAGSTTLLPLTSGEFGDGFYRRSPTGISRRSAFPSGRAEGLRLPMWPVRRTWSW